MCISISKYFLLVILLTFSYSGFAMTKMYNMQGMHTADKPIDKKYDHSMNASDMHGMHNMQTMLGLYGRYPMSREASGTSWEPQATPLQGIHFMSKTRPCDSAMVAGFITLIDDHQGGPRGASKGFSTNMLMGMGRKEIEDNIFGIRGMISLDPLMGKRGYPLLFQVGETADGKHELVDRQHPHDAFMELAVTYSRIFNDNSSAYVYLALPGEPAVGPPIYMQRYSAMEIPEAPLTHHKLDSTHITFGVITLGYIYHGLKLEGSLFNGREPDQYRWDIEAPNLNSQALRLSYNPTERLALQISTASLKSPEQISPNINTNRSTASIMYDHPLCGENHWQTTVALGVNINKPGKTLNGYLVESTLNIRTCHYFFGRFEQSETNDLFDEGNPLHDKIFNISKLSLGYLYDITHFGHVKLGIGGLISFFQFPGILKPYYGNSPVSYMLFARLRF